MKVIVIAPDKAPEVREIDGSLESFQAIVGGYIEQVPVWPALGPGFTSFVNEEGIRLKLPINPTFSAVAGEPIRGAAVITHEDEDNPEELRGLTDEECAVVLGKVSP